jgi:hypothetical protein
MTNYPTAKIPMVNCIPGIESFREKYPDVQIHLDFDYGNEDIRFRFQVGESSHGSGSIPKNHIFFILCDLIRGDEPFKR